MEDLCDLRELNQSCGVTYGEIDLDHAFFASVLLVHRPKVRNALNIEAIRAFSTFVDQIVETPSARRIATLVYGVGGSFIAGGDLKDLHDQRDAATAREMSTLMRTALLRLRALPGLLTMVADGAIIGGGAEVFISGDYRFISKRSKLRFAQSSLGLSTGWGGGRRLSQLIGRAEALVLLLEGETFTAEHCIERRLAHHLVEDGSSFQSAVDWLKIQSQRSQAVYGIKRMLTHDDYSEIDQLEAELFPSLWTSREHWSAVDELWREKPKTQSPMRREEQMEINMSEEKPGQSTSDVLQSSINPRGLFVVLEGIDGAGTTTQVKNIVAALRALGREAHMTQEPSGGIIGTLTRRALRGELIGIDSRPLPAESIALLFAADRADHWYNEIEPRLERGEDVICDRYLYSSLAYQGIELADSWVRALNQSFPRPDLLLFIDVEVSVAAERRDARGQEADRYEVDELQQQIADRYSSICREFKAQIINGELGVDEVTTACLDALIPLVEVSRNVTQKER